MSFFDRLADRIDAVDSLLCVGLDPVPDRLPPEVADADLPRWAFNRRIIDQTHEYVAAYKPNIAFYEDYRGWQSLAETIAYADGKGVPIILDAKRGDIGHTARQYARLLDPEPWGLKNASPDAITVNPWLGEDSLQPFLDRPDKGVFILCRTSNAGGSDIQSCQLASGVPVYEHVAKLAQEWDRTGTVGLVVGATVPEELESLRALVPSIPFLVPGVGAQGGDIEAAVTAGPADGVGIINSSRGVIYAGEESEHFFKAAGASARRLHHQLNEFRER